MNSYRALYAEDRSALLYVSRFHRLPLGERPVSPRKLGGRSREKKNIPIPNYAIPLYARQSVRIYPQEQEWTIETTATIDAKTNRAWIIALEGELSCANLLNPIISPSYAGPVVLSIQNQWESRLFDVTAGVSIGTLMQVQLRPHN